jgi:hypothetical protein
MMEFVAGKTGTGWGYYAAPLRHPSHPSLAVPFAYLCSLRFGLCVIETTRGPATTDRERLGCGFLVASMRYKRWGVCDVMGRKRLPSLPL